MDIKHERDSSGAWRLAGVMMVSPTPAPAAAPSDADSASDSDLEVEVIDLCSASDDDDGDDERERSAFATAVNESLRDYWRSASAPCFDHTASPLDLTLSSEDESECEDDGAPTDSSASVSASVRSPSPSRCTCCSSTDNTHLLACDHVFCSACAGTSARLCFADDCSPPARCCGNELPLALIRGALSDQEFALYTSKATSEATTTSEW